ARQTVRSAVRCAVARTYRVMGLYRQAAEQARIAVDTARGAQPGQPAELADALFELGEGHRARQERNEARAAVRETLEVVAKAHGEESRGVADVSNARAGVSLVFGDYDDAEKNIRRSLEIQTKLSGEKDARTAMLMGNLGQILNKQNKGEEALALVKRAAEIH